MLEVGNLANATEDRSHFGAWAIMSSPLVLSFDLTDAARMDRAWPIVSNRLILAVNQRWVGDPGRRVSVSDDGWQAWAKRMGATSFAVFLVNAGEEITRVSLPLRNVSTGFSPAHGVCLRDLYAGSLLPPLLAAAPLEAKLAAHDSAFYCAWPSASDGACDQEASQCP